MGAIGEYGEDPYRLNGTVGMQLYPEVSGVIFGFGTTAAFAGTNVSVLNSTTVVVRMPAHFAGVVSVAVVSGTGTLLATLTNASTYVV